MTDLMRLKPSSTRRAVAIVAISWLVYAASWPLGHASLIGDIYAAVALLPTVITAHLFGGTGARWIAAGFLPFQVALYLAVGHQPGWDMFAGAAGLFALASVPLVGLYVGWASDLRGRLERMHHDRDRFVASVAHDIKNPLTGVIGLSLTLAEDPSLGDEQRELASLIATEAQVATDVIEDLSVTALRNSGKFAIHPEAFDVLEDVAAAAQRIGAGVAAGSDRLVWADRRRFRQVLQNLSSNAERHGAAPFDFVVSRVGGHIAIALRDRGSGIPAGLVDRLFEPFGLAGFSDHLESTGLGLSSSRVLATLMHGDLKYRRVDGVTEFTLTLPAAHPSTSITTSEATTEKPSA
jgi:signal transduction histidine kinase